MDQKKLLNDMTDEELDELDVELMSDEEIEAIEDYLRSLFTPEELREMFTTKNTAKIEANLRNRKMQAL
jgi:hypothetical protein